MNRSSRPQNPQHVRRRRSGIALPEGWGTYALLGAFVLVVVGVAYLVFTGVRNLVSGAPLGASGAEISAADGDAPAQSVAAGAEVDEDDPMWSEGRVTVLLMGIDERESETGPWRTDTMILLTMEPATRTAGMISIPRDLWVEIPDYGAYDRINTAFFRGDRDLYPGGGGAALAMKTVQQNFGISVNHYVTVNFQAFTQLVDQIGCIPVSVPETIDDPTYPAYTGYGYDPFYIEEGEHCLDGETLLKYARTRATFGSDFDRARRQQQVIYAIRDEVLRTGQMPALIAKAPELYNTLADNVQTTFDEGQLIQLARLAGEIPQENICSAVISGDYIDRFETLADGSQVVIADRSSVRQLILDIFSGTGQCSPETQDVAEAARAENATIRVLNGTRQEGLATETGDRLSAAGLDVIEVGNADRFDYSETMITDYSGSEATARYLASVLNVPESAIVVGESASPLYDIEVVLGADLLR